MSDHPEPCAHPSGGAERSYLLRIRVGHDGARYLVQDLKTGERHEFESEVQLRRFIAERGVTGLR
ncbi:MAG: hypothetical protein MUC86_17735 [Burkholderiaceae bacterium]|jgi:hypothetical protein|nr:hypothetical protein [Burkholderiaceae bacterium]